jgi:signal transduction histidine kinase
LRAPIRSKLSGVNGSYTEQALIAWLTRRKAVDTRSLLNSATSPATLRHPASPPAAVSAEAPDKQQVQRDSERERQIRAEQYALAYREVPLVCLATVIGGVLLAFGLHDGRPPLAALLWLAALYLVQSLSFPLVRRYHKYAKSSPGDRRWGIALVVCATLSGSMWGMSAFVMFPADLAYQVLLTGALFMVCVSAIISMSGYLPALYGVTTAVLLPLAIRLAAQGDFVHGALATGVGMLLAVLIFYARHFNAALLNSINMRFENAELYEALTEQRIRERTRVLEAASRHKSEFLANMSHELRTPLNAVIGFSEMLKTRLVGDLNGKQSQYVELIHASGLHLLSLINDVLDLSKVEAGRMELSLSSFDIRLALDNAVTLMKERAQRNEIELVLDVDARLGCWLADERKFKQVVLNLLSNAVKFTPKAGRVVVQARAVPDGLQVSVSDTGVGIALEHHEAIFEEFQQIAGDYTTKPEGTGLGLSLARKFVELHGGTIGVQSALGLGSTFAFTLPVKPCPTNLS